MPKIKITCDSTCDLSPDLYERYHISVIPMCVALGDRVCRDGENVEPKELFAYVEETGKLPTTSAISVGEYEDWIKASMVFPRVFPTRLSHEAFPQGCPTCTRGGSRSSA